MTDFIVKIKASDEETLELAFMGGSPSGSPLGPVAPRTVIPPFT